MTALQNGIKYEKYITMIIKSQYKNIWLWKDICDKNSDRWYNASEAATALEYKLPRDTIKKRIDKDHKRYICDIETNGKIKKQPKTVYLNKNGLLSLIFGSRLKNTENLKNFAHII